jgi:hypothetical protein
MSSESTSIANPRSSVRIRLRWPAALASGARVSVSSAFL